MTDFPKSTQVLVVGGGPAGSTAATLLAREGFSVTLAEREVFPRYHIGESLLPSALRFFDLLGVREKIEAHGFQRKPGGIFEWGTQQWDLFFGELMGNHVYSFQVIRSELDHLLLEHAKSQGVQVFEGVTVREIGLAKSSERKPHTATLQEADGSAHEIAFDFLVDGSGRAGLMASRYLRNRRYHEAFKNVALWGYWKDAKRLDGAREGSISSVSIPEGWIWIIPLHDGTTSVGVVLHKKIFKARRTGISQEQLYRDLLAGSQFASRMVAPGELISDLRIETDYSYAAKRFAGPGYFLVGDAACFLDPLLSTGVHLAMFSGMLAAASISSILRGEVGRREARAFFEKSYRHAYLRFLVFLLAFYNQFQGKESIFWVAHQLSRHDASANDLKLAFTTLVSGVEDLKDVEDGAEAARTTILDQTSHYVQENLALREDKDALEAMGLVPQRYENARFFSKIEDISILSPDAAIDGLYVATEPHLRLQRVPSTNGSHDAMNGHHETVPLNGALAPVGELVAASY